MFRRRVLAILPLSLVLGVTAANAQNPPAEPPAAPPPQQPPPGYPPYPYPYPYPPGPYPYPPPYYYPPPNYPYTWPAQPSRPKAKPLPDDFAARTTPFIDALVTLGGYEDRFSHAFDLGVQAGTFIDGRFRLAARLIGYLTSPDDESSQLISGEWTHAESDSPTIAYAAIVGVAMMRRPKFLLSPSLVLSRTDDTDYGTFFGVGVPFEWVMVGGLRIGFQVEIGRAFGGSLIERCQNLGGPQSCVPGEERRVDRPAGVGLMLDFHIGWGIFQPKPPQ